MKNQDFVSTNRLPSEAVQAMSNNMKLAKGLELGERLQLDYNESEGAEDFQKAVFDMNLNKATNGQLGDLRHTTNKLIDTQVQAQQTQQQLTNKVNKWFTNIEAMLKELSDVLPIEYMGDVLSKYGEFKRQMGWRIRDIRYALENQARDKAGANIKALKSQLADFTYEIQDLKKSCGLPHKVPKSPNADLSLPRALKQRGKLENIGELESAMQGGKSRKDIHAAARVAAHQRGKLAAEAHGYHGVYSPRELAGMGKELKNISRAALKNPRAVYAARKQAGKYAKETQMVDLDCSCCTHADIDACLDCVSKAYKDLDRIPSSEERAKKMGFDMNMERGSDTEGLKKQKVKIDNSRIKELHIHGKA